MEEVINKHKTSHQLTQPPLTSIPIKEYSTKNEILHQHQKNKKSLNASLIQMVLLTQGLDPV